MCLRARPCGSKPTGKGVATLPPHSATQRVTECTPVSSTATRGNPRQGEWIPLRRGLAAIAAFLPVFAIHWNSIQNHFWQRLPVLLDSGWFGSLLAHGGWLLCNPSSLGGSSFYQTHMSLLLAPLSPETPPDPAQDVLTRG